MRRIQQGEYQKTRAFLRQLSQLDNRLGQRLRMAIEEELTERQAEMVRMYFLEQHTMREIATMLGVYPSTVSRTLASARVKLKRCLRYGAKKLLDEEDEEM